MDSAFFGIQNGFVCSFDCQMQIIPEDIRPHIMQTPQFWTVFFMYVFNAGADFAAYSFAPLSVVSPISGVVSTRF
jgi:hypothetical protein